MEPGEGSFSPVRMLEIELARPLPAVRADDPAGGRAYTWARALIRLHTQPLGVIELCIGEGLTPSALAERIWRELGHKINAHLREDGLPEIAALSAAGLPASAPPACERARALALAAAPLASVIVCTRDRTEDLDACLASLVAQEYPDFEIIVVDNAPATAATAELIATAYGDLPRVRYVREGRPGLSWARNRGLREAKGQIVAYTDDDVVVDRGWLGELVKGFRAAENVACVTGLTIPAELETEPQAWFEQFCGFTRGFDRVVYTRESHRRQDALYPYRVGTFGAGVNMAFDATILSRLGGFDPALSVGTPTCGGEDVAIFLRVITEGFALVYEPGALVRHFHRRDYARLKRQAYGYGVGFTAFLTECVAVQPWLFGDLARKVPTGLVAILRARSAKHSKRQGQFPRELTRVEYWGMLYGPLAYLRSRWRVRQAGHGA